MTADARSLCRSAVFVLVVPLPVCTLSAGFPVVASVRHLIGYAVVVVYVAVGCGDVVSCV